MKRHLPLAYVTLALLFGLVGCIDLFPTHIASPSEPPQAAWPFNPASPIVSFDLQGYHDQGFGVAR